MVRAVDRDELMSLPRKPCRNCKEPYTPDSANQWYCPRCKELVRLPRKRLNQAAYMRRKQEVKEPRVPPTPYLWCEGYGDVGTACHDGQWDECQRCVHKRSKTPGQREYMAEFRGT